jgi:hypothetical protein
MLFIENVKNTEDTDIMIELYRGKQYCNLQKIFIDSCLKNLEENVFKNKKNLNRTLINLLSSWMFTLYSKYDFMDDPFFPTNYNYFDNLIKTLQDYTSLYDIDNIDVKIMNIVNDMKKSYKMILYNIKEYKKSIFYLNNKNKLKVIKKNIIEKRNDDNINFYQFQIKYTFTFYLSNIKLNNIINNIIIPVDEYNKMINNYNNTNLKYNDNIDNLIWIILFRYQLLSSNNNQLAVLPDVLDKMKNKFGLDYECFASAINTNTKRYCSIYYDVEKYFGSKGSFFNTKFLDGCYSFNPPYQKDIIDNGIMRIFEQLETSKILDMKLTFIIAIPIWDNEGKEYMKQLNSENNNNNIKYDDMKIIKKVKSSKFFSGLRMISKSDFTYMDHNFHLFKNETIQNTYIIVLSNFQNSYIKYINDIDFYTYKNI